MSQSVSAEAASLVEQTRGGDPREMPFGVIVHDCSAGISLFSSHWFHTEEAVANFLSIALSNIFIDRKEQEVSDDEIRKMVDRMVAWIRKDGLQISQLDTIRAMQASHFYIIWWGTFDELCDSPVATASIIRSFFRESLVDLSVKNAPKISEQERGEFAVFLDEMYR